MNVGIVSYWFNRGQATVGRFIRSAFDELGHRTFVLARPTQDHFDLPRFVDRTDVWEQSDVTEGSHFQIPVDEYLLWAQNNSLDVVFFDQNYQFEEIKALRESGVKTIGRFVWEAFKGEHVNDAVKALDVIYSLTECERERYKTFGIDSPYFRWGCHPELTGVRPDRCNDTVRFFYPGGYLSKRKPTKATIEAFSGVSAPNIRMVLKVQRKKRHEELIGDLSGLDPRIEIISDDMSTDDYYRLFSSCHIALAPSRWEGLGLHLYEALAFGMPIITNDRPPMNEVVRHDFNGRLIPSIEIGKTPSGVFSFDPSVEDLAKAIHMFTDPAILNQMSKNTYTMQQEFCWENTVEGLSRLLDA